MSTQEMSFKELGLKFYFVIKDGLEDIQDVSSDMSAAFASIREYIDEENGIVWLSEEEVMASAPKMELTKKHIFVLECFEGRAFKYLTTTRALVIGPRCLLSCLMENTSVPLGTSPVFTTAMRNLVVCASGLAPQEKEKIRNLVQWMGGYYSDDLSSSCTHLVSNTVKSDKYEKAAVNDIIIMHPDWVYDVWARSRKENVLATSKEFDKNKLPIFYALYITTSGLPSDKKNEIMKLITENGGHYTGLFKSSQTDILITEKNMTDSAKYEAATRYKKFCLIPDWVTDSVKKGYALPTDHYKVVALKVSTPTKMEKSVSATDFNPDCTQLSEISRLEAMRSNSTVNETIANMSVASTVRPHPPKHTRPKYKDILAQISTQQAKKAGAFLDGCCIYSTGFTADEKEKLNKILNVGGAIRYDEMNEKITHCIVGEPTVSELHKMGDHGVQILTLEWLAESIKHKLPVQEEKYIYQAKAVNTKVPEPPSPSSKKTIESMNHSFKKPALPKSRLDFASAKPSSSKVLDMDQFEDEQNDFLSQYTPENAAPLPPKPTAEPQAIPTSSTNFESEGFDSEMCTEDYNNLNFFIGFTVHVHDHDEEIYQQLVDDCENAGAKLVDKNFKGLADYVIVPSEQATDLKEVKVRAKHIVNNIWIEEAIKENKIVDLKYYHEPIPDSANSQPLAGMVIVISIYSNNERLYIETLATILGATKQDSYAKKQKPLLICPTPEGAKYNAAIKWNYPVVRSEWLVECAEKGEKVSLEPYLVGESILSTSGSWYAAKSSSSASSDLSMNQNEKERSLAASKLSAGQQSDNPLEDEVFLPKSSPAKEKRTSELMENAENEGLIAKQTTGKTKRKDSGPENRIIEDLAAADRNVATTPEGTAYLRHRRLSELAEPGRRSSKGMSISSPATPPPAGDLNISDLVKEVSTPHRDLLYNVLKEMQSKETPESQRIRKLVATPGAQTKTPPTPKIPDFVQTPEVRKRRLAFLDSYYLPPTRSRKPSTPFSEIKKRFWKEALGDQYLEEGNYNTQTFTQVEDDAGTSTGRETQNLAATDIHVKRLSDFINNRDAENQNRNDMHLPELETESVPQKFDSEMGGTEELIGWRDPSEFTQEARTKVKQMKHVGTPRFSMSCSDDQLRLKIIDQIKKLNGEICENLVTFDDSCTHIVCERPNRGEKILSGIASGKWILELKYIEDSFEAGCFLDEELYEWGNPKATNLPKLIPGEQLIANAAFRWRKKISGRSEKDAGGVFQGFRVILHVARKDQFQKLIVAGGGVVLDVSEPYSVSEEALTATHCLVETKKIKLSSKDHKALSEAGILVLSVMYLNAHLTSEVQPDYTKYLLSL